MRAVWRAWLWMLACGSFGAQAAPEQFLPLPDVSGPVTLRVAYVENPRFAAIEPERLRTILALARTQMREQLGLVVAFNKPVRLPIAQVFSALSPAWAHQAERERMDATLDPVALESLVPGLLQDLRDAGDVATQERFAAPYLVRPPADTTDIAFARALLATHHALLTQWGTARARDGRPAIGPDRYNEYSYWNVLGHTDLPFEVIVTNQLIASAERSENSVHSAIRGGLSNGITTQNRSGRFQLMSILSSYAFVAPAPLARQLRGTARLNRRQENLYMARLLVHELGHQLLHLGHPFGNAYCIMAPPKALEFTAWSNGLRPDRCPLGSSRQQTPGFIQFPPLADNPD